MTSDNNSLQDSRPSDIAVLLRSHPLFAETNLAALTKLLSCGQMLTLRPGEVLMRQGEASHSAYIIIEGSGAIRIETSYGTVNLSTVSAPTLVGEIGVFMGVPRTATVESTTPLCALRIESGDLQKFGSENPQFLAAVMWRAQLRSSAPCYRWLHYDLGAVPRLTSSRICCRRAKLAATSTTIFFSTIAV